MTTKKSVRLVFYYKTLDKFVKATEIKSYLWAYYPPEFTIPGLGTFKRYEIKLPEYKKIKVIYSKDL